MAAEPEPVAAHYGAVYRFVRKRARSREEAEDVTQDVFLAAINALNEARLDEPSLAWLYTVAQRRLIDRLRRSAPAPEPAPPEPKYADSVVSSLVASLNELDAGRRRVIVMKLFEGRPFREIAGALDLTEEACRARFSRGLRELQEHLREKGVEP